MCLISIKLIIYCFFQGDGDKKDDEKKAEDEIDPLDAYMQEVQQVNVLKPFKTFFHCIVAYNRNPY